MKYTVLFIAVALICGCDSSKKSNIDGATQMYIDPQKAESIKVGDYFKYASFIPLETTDDNLIAYIGKVQFYNSQIYVMDGKQKSIFIFDKDGKYLRKIFRHGQGPEEYVYLDDFTIDPATGNIRIYDGSSDFVLDYTGDGAFIGKRKASKGFSFARMKNNRTLIYTQQECDSGFYNVHIVDEDFVLTDVFLPFHKQMRGRMYLVGKTRNILSEYSDTIYIMRPLGDKIYVYDAGSNTVKCKYQITVEGEPDGFLDPNAGENEAKAYLAKLDNHEVSFGIYGFHKINSLVFFSYSGKRDFFCIYNEQTGKVICNKNPQDENGLRFQPAVYWTDGERQIMNIIEITDVKQIIADTDNASPVLKEISKAVKDDDANPILVFYEVVIND
ncbi:MAG: 6-bladed beta-propeller [Prevotellaceae bacterium]|jgi:hypothetical protein|nr:6-bladed beta-propeller [Prevotellaceae bacterium]